MFTHCKWTDSHYHQIMRCRGMRRRINLNISEVLEVHFWSKSHPSTLTVLQFTVLHHFGAQRMPPVDLFFVSFICLFLNQFNRI